ncbi:MAG: hypothetical protein KKI08_12560 [Armatimonadetes bacterium]|nr:hypothetical protein [Armatimonadota bacterium]
MTGRPALLPAAIIVCSLALHGATMAAEEAAQPPPVTSEFAVSLGGQALSVEGNDRRFEQYVTPPQGMYLPEIIWQRLDPTGSSPSFDLSVLDLFAPDPSAALWLDWAGMNLDGQYRRSRYFLDFDPASAASRRWDYQFNLEPDARAGRHTWFSLGTQQVSLEGMPSSGPVDWNSQTHSAALGLRSGNLWFGLNYAREDFDDALTGRTEALSGSTQSYSLSLSSRPSDRTQISGHAAWHVTDLDAYANDLRSWDAALTVLHPLTDDFTLTGQFRHFGVSRTIIADAYARNQTRGSVEAEWVPSPGTVLTAEWANAITGYVDGMQLNTVDVESNVMRLGVRSHLGRTLKLRGRYSRFDNGNRPLYYHVDGSLGNTLIYSTRTRTELSATYTPAAPWGLSALWQMNTWGNNAQDISNAVETAMLTGWWQGAGGKLALTASLMHQTYDLPLRSLTTLTGYESWTESGVLSATYAFSDKNSAYATYTRALSHSATSNEQWRLLFGYSQQAGPHDRMVAEINTGEFVDDDDATLGVGADRYRLEWRHQL